MPRNELAVLSSPTVPLLVHLSTSSKNDERSDQKPEVQLVKPPSRKERRRRLQRKARRRLRRQRVLLRLRKVKPEEELLASNRQRVLP